MAQVVTVTKRWPEVSKISFVAHSLGGLVARYAIGKLYENDASNSEQLNDASIAGLQPVNFITFATPHLGSRGHKQVGFIGILFKLYTDYSFLFNYISSGCQRSHSSHCFVVFLF